MKKRHNSGSRAAGMDNITGPASNLDLLKPDLVKYDENQVSIGSKSKQRPPEWSSGI